MSDTVKLSHIFQSKVEKEFNLNADKLHHYLKRTTDDLNSTLWKKIFNFSDNVDFTSFKNEEADLSTPLEKLSNPKLVYSFLLHYLGRGIFCSKTVFDRFKGMLSVLLKETMTEFDPSTKLNFTSVDEYLNETHTIDEIITAYLELSPDYKKSNEQEISWDQFVSESTFREQIISKLRAKNSKYRLRESDCFFKDFLANLQFDNFCFNSLVSVNSKETLFSSERSVCWVFPLDVEIKVEQKKEILGYRRDSIYNKSKKHIKRLELNSLDKDLDLNMHATPIRSILKNDPVGFESYFKKHSSRQLISELTLVIFGNEVQKNPAALIYNMMIIDLLDAEKITKRDMFNSDDMTKYPIDKGHGGLAPYSINGATTAARYLNIYYSYIFDHWYSYDINDDNEVKIIENLMNPKSDYNVKRNYKIRFDELMQREFDMVNTWIEYRKIKDDAARNIKTIKDLFDYIFIKTGEFYEELKFHVK